jgi:hypothetical protein
MKIVISGSLSFPKRMIKVKKTLQKQGHQVFIPPLTHEYANGTRKKGNLKEEVQAKKTTDTLKLYFKEIKKSNALLVLNYTNKGIRGYIGANTLIEMAFAHILGKKIYLLNPIPKMAYQPEIVYMEPTVINKNLDLIQKS